MNISDKTGDDNSAGILGKHKKNNVFVSTRAVDEGLRVLQKYGILIYKGIPGQGKTTNALEVMRRLYDIDNEYFLLELGDISEWNKYININVKTCVLLNDFLESESTLNKDAYVRSIHACIAKGNVKVIATARTNTTNANRKALEKHRFHTDHFVDLSSGNFQLSNEEKRNIFKSYCENNNICVCFDVEHENVHSADILDKQRTVYIHEFTELTFVCTNTIIGFPKTCLLFCTNREYTRLGILFFKHPSERLIQELTSKRKSKDQHERRQFAVLSYMFCNKEVFDFKHFRKDLMDKLNKSLYLQWDIKLEQIDDVLHDMKEQYVMKESNKEVYRFKHDRVSDAVGLSLGMHDVHLVIESCTLDFLKTYVRTENYLQKEDEVILRVRHENYSILSRMAFKYVFNEHNLFNERDSILHCQIFKDKSFLACFAMYLAIVPWERISWRVPYLFLTCSVCLPFEFPPKYRVDIARLEVLDEMGLTRRLFNDDNCLQILLNEVCLLQNIEFAKLLIAKAKTNDVLPNTHRKHNQEMFRIESLLYNVSCKHGFDKYIKITLESRKLSESDYINGFYLAIVYEQPETVDLFLRSKSDGNLLQNDECFLHIAAMFGSDKVFKKLLDLGLDYSKRTKKGTSVLHEAFIGFRVIRQRYLPLVPFADQMFLEKCKDIRNYMDSYWEIRHRFPNSSISIIQSLLDQKYLDIYELEALRDAEGNGLAHFAAADGLLSVLDFIIQNRPVLVFTQNSQHLHPIEVAAYLGRNECFEVLFGYMKKHLPTIISKEPLSLFNSIYTYIASVSPKHKYGLMTLPGNRDVPRPPDILLYLWRTVGFNEGNLQISQYKKIMESILN